MNLNWQRSTFCGTGACVEVIREGDIVLVRDAKLGDDSKTSEWDRNEWADLIDAIKYGRDHQNILEEEVGSWFGGLWFTAEEWTAFVKGVKAGEFDYDRLSTPAPDPARQVPDEAVPVGTGSGLAATGAGEVFADSGEPVPVAAPEAVTETIRADQLTPGRTVLIPMTESLETVTRVRVSGSYVTVHTNRTGPDSAYQWPAGEEISAVVVVPPVPVAAQPREISDELVEMVARAQYEYDTDDIPTDLGYAWDETIAVVRNEYVRRARAGIEVAIPLLRKQWENEAEPAWGSGPLVDHNPSAGMSEQAFTRDDVKVLATGVGGKYRGDWWHIQIGEQYFIISAVDLVFGSYAIPGYRTSETMAFEADASGEVTDWGELAMVPSKNHEACIADLLEDLVDHNPETPGTGSADPDGGVR